jgi:hypothetical protein
MIIRSVCNSCYQRYEIVCTTDVKVSTAMLAQLMDEAGMGVCPRGCGGRINLTNDATIDAVGAYLKEPLHLTVTQLFQAAGGMPLPDEIPPSHETVSSLLIANKIEQVTLEDYNGRLFVHELHLSNCCIIHLCAGGRGAQVLKVTRRLQEVPT